ncbi:DUF6221 family protein [Streptomyces sp. NPDC056638]|uniref:DUF6221 family protein n=1 Tax=Streptomyces sp. NPDC056638 TaxID=3345887 RepID=UPI00369AFF4D
MDDLVQFLRDRLDEDEQAARRVKSSWRQIGETGVIVASDGERAEECANGNWTGIAEHIVRHDPARIMAEVEAKRRILRAHEKWCEGRCEAKYPEGGFDAAHFWSIKSLATVYADHPDYRDTWRP